MILLRTANKSGGGRAMAGEQRRASGVCTQQTHQYLQQYTRYIFFDTGYASVLALLCTTNTRATAGERRGERCMYTAIQPMYLVLHSSCCGCRRCMSIFSSLLISVGIAGVPSVSAPDLAVGTWAWVQARGTDALPPRGPALVEARAKASG